MELAGRDVVPRPVPPLTAFYQDDITLLGAGMTGAAPREANPMNAPNDNAGPKGPRGWWASPPRTGIRNLIAPYEYRHLRFFGYGRIVGGSVAAVAGVVCLSYRVYGWAAFFLVLGALNLAGGSWYLAIDRSVSGRA